jgi:hypothetical protein
VPSDTDAVLRAIALSESTGHPIRESELPVLTRLPADRLAVALDQVTHVKLATKVSGALDATAAGSVAEPGWILLADGRKLLGLDGATRSGQ